MREQAHSFLSLDRFHRSAKVLHYQWSGLIPCAFIDDLLTKARKLVRTTQLPVSTHARTHLAGLRPYIHGVQVANKTVPWAAVMVTGFEDAPLSWYTTLSGPL